MNEYVGNDVNNSFMSKKNRVIMIELRGDRYSMKNSETYCCIHANQKDCGVENWMRIT